MKNFDANKPKTGVRNACKHERVQGSMNIRRTECRQSLTRRLSARMARLFASKYAVASGQTDAGTLVNSQGKIKYPVGVPDRGSHSATPHNENGPDEDRGGILHVYPNASGALKPNDRVGLYIPKNFELMKRVVTSTNAYLFHDKTSGVYMTVAHIDSTGVKFGESSNEAGSRLFGYFVTGDGKFLGSSDGFYVHTHISFFSKWDGSITGGTRMDPRSLFCPDLGF